MTILPFSSDGKPVRVWDLIVFHSGSRLICHRVLGVFRFGRHIYYYEKGDANRLGWIVSESKLIGKVTAIDGQAIRIHSNPSEKSTSRFKILSEILLSKLKNLGRLGSNPK
ncbi:MAG: hypothetical protein COT43_11165 [Candidatus Marinimicrobia bacterium CG08_land_8_20_14_0_20_45_22]|nr:MAG: hypothetical protein COT43_11165 [Candidatus Marinimicrobia bacterium CG08_land_8_20_14_0_20_45_22]